MSRSRREFLAQGSLGLLAAAIIPQTTEAAQVPQTPGAPPAFGTAPPVGPAVSPETFAAAEKLVQVELTPADRAQAAGNWQQSMATVYERRVGPRKVAIEEAIAPATVWNPVLAASQVGVVAAGQFHLGATTGAPLPAHEEDIAFASTVQLSHWIHERKITSERLTKIYLQRLEKYNKQLNCVITLTADHALDQARRADEELAAGHDRGPLHGIPWGAKDLLDTAGIPTTWGAEPYRDRIPAKDATVTQRLNDAGAVLVAKLSLGALALNDVWFGGQTKNPWLLEEGASGSSAGPGSAVAAGLVGFAIGSETQGSIVSPSMRCGVTGLRPTYGRVPRTGAMTLSWTCDKLGAMTRGVVDTMLVLNAISGPDGQDDACVPSKLNFAAGKSVAGLRVGYFPAWMKEAPATAVDRAALETIKKLGMVPVEVSLPDWPYDSLNIILFAESAAAFEELTLSHKVDELKMQVPDAWPNTFRQSRFLSAVDFVQADRLRRKVALEMARVMSEVDVLLVPSLRDEALVITNFTGHPSLTLRAGFVEVTEARSDWAPDPKHPLPKFATPRRVPYGVTLIGRLFEEGTLAQAGMAMEQAFAVASERPAGF
ncbi:amidase [Granulicella mallensis]|uniref:Amidase n=1 Tax=Granulicella mallensis (strain ATCC BAA-1857 / DSM 23137 / MP5ACTX8) TaxID=682795 RepID=G8NRS8_GRAMM|nr:amidase [Granulicella mallensis]AEU35041.1 Amidase [Granulicella mallensis MP5ACTX8]